MKTFPKTIYALSCPVGGKDFIFVRDGDGIAPATKDGDTIAVYELRAIKTVKKTFDLVDVNESAPVPYEAR